MIRASITWLATAWLVAGSISAAQPGTLRIAASDLSPGALPLDEPWLFRGGDEAAWADPAFDDSSWQSSATHLEPGKPTPEGWAGFGWFRLHLEVDEAQWSRPLALFIDQRAGASEVFLDGESVARLGRVGTRREDEKGTRQSETVWITLAPPGEHVLAVRHSDFLAPTLGALDQEVGFKITLVDDPDVLQRRWGLLRRFAAEQALFTGVPLVFCLLHLLFFAFEPRSRENLYFALFTFSFGGMAFVDYQHQLPMQLSTLVLMRMLLALFFAALLLSGLGFAYTLLFDRLPARFWIFVAGAVLVLGWSLLMPRAWVLAWLLLAAQFVELIRHLPEFRRQRRDGAWILAIGLLAFVFAAMLDGLIDLDLLESVLGTTNPYLYGGLVLLFSMSIYLARSFARAREQEITRRLLEADHSRKTRELEEARQLQLSLLPSELPSHSLYAVAAGMRTATEVGGDYYDFHADDDGTLTLAIGDAAGHGARAGTLVAVTKSLFNALAGRGDLVETLGRFDEGLRGMSLRRVHMALTLARFRDGGFELAAAGMPPALVHRAATGEVEEIAVPGLPLGTSKRSRHQRREVALHPADAVLFMTDGFPELHGAEGQELGYARARNLYREACADSPVPGAILERLHAAIEAWTRGTRLRDDVTLVVVKRT